MSTHQHRDYRIDEMRYAIAPNGMHFNTLRVVHGYESNGYLG